MRSTHAHTKPDGGTRSAIVKHTHARTHMSVQRVKQTDTVCCHSSFKSKPNFSHHQTIKLYRSTKLIQTHWHPHKNTQPRTYTHSLIAPLIMNINFSDKKIECINGTEYQQLSKNFFPVYLNEQLRINCVLISVFNFSDSKKSYCPKCHPYIAGCIVVLIFLFTVYHRKQIESFFTPIFFDDNDASHNGTNITSAATVTTTTKSSRFSADSNATYQHLLANGGIQQTIGLCNLPITIAISLLILLI